VNDTDTVGLGVGRGVRVPEHEEHERTLRMCGSEPKTKTAMRLTTAVTMSGMGAEKLLSAAESDVLYFGQYQHAVLAQTILIIDGKTRMEDVRDKRWTYANATVSSNMKTSVRMVRELYVVDSLPALLVRRALTRHRVRRTRVPVQMARETALMAKMPTKTSMAVFLTDVRMECRMWNICDGLTLSPGGKCSKEGRHG
jgi:hypothetical protein